MLSFTVANEAEAIALLGMLIIAIGMLIFSEIMDRPPIVFRIVASGLMFYLFTQTKSSILQVCFLGLTIYNLFRTVGRV